MKYFINGFEENKFNEKIINRKFIKEVKIFKQNKLSILLYNKFFILNYFFVK